MRRPEDKDMTSSSSKQRFFFVHIMKTGGTSLARAMDPSFSAEERYPGAPDKDEKMTAKASVNYLRNLPKERLNEIRSFNGHMPFFASKLVGPDVLSLTMLRGPVARVVSHLKQTKRMSPYFESMSLDEIYDIPWLFHSYFNNQQTKAFSMSANDLVELCDQDERHSRLAQYSDNAYNLSEPNAQMLKAMLYTFGWDAPINEERMAIAKANLKRVDILGFLDRFDELLSTLENDYDLRVQHMPPSNTGHQEQASADLLARIEEDNPYDLELYQYGQELYAQRHHEPV